jgi:hypothetical protein
MYRGLALIIAAVLLVGCVVPPPELSLTGSGNPVTVEKDLDGFTKVAASAAFRVTVTQGEDYRVSVTVDDNVEPHLNVVVQGDTLRIGIKPGISFRPGIRQMRAEIVMPALRGIETSGAASAEITGFTSDADLSVEASGASGVKGEITAGDVKMNVSGASKVTLAGAGQALDVEASGASSIDLADFPVTSATVDVSGASQVEVQVNGRLSGEVSGASRLYYSGDAELGSIESSGSSRVESR